LLASKVTQNMRGTRLEAIPGAPPDLANLPAGCAFAERCRHADAQCLAAAPPYDIGGGRGLACYHPLAHEGADKIHAS